MHHSLIIHLAKTHTAFCASKSKSLGDLLPPIGVLIRAVLTCASNTEFTFDFRVQVYTFLSHGACRKVFAEFSWVHERALISRLGAVREVLAFYQLLLGHLRIRHFDAYLFLQIYHFLFLREIPLVIADDAKPVPPLLLLACVLIGSFQFRHQICFVNLFGFLSPLKLGKFFLLVIVVNN